MLHVTASWGPMAKAMPCPETQQGKTPDPSLPVPTVRPCEGTEAAMVVRWQWGERERPARTPSCEGSGAKTPPQKVREEAS